VLYDCHSIRSQIPFLFDGTLPDFNIGTNNGETCAPVIEAGAVADLCGAEGYSSVLNGRFKGGWTTRHYGRPAKTCTPSRWNWRRAPICHRGAPFAYDEARPPGCAFISRQFSNSVALADWRPR
jgi:N-formylglutamate deformylase